MIGVHYLLESMDFLDPKKKKQHLIRLYIGYFLVAVALALGSLVLLFRAYGYDFDRKTGEVVQNGMVFIDAHPESADVYLNGQRYKDRTATRMELPVGQYSLELKRDGYRPWKRNFTLEGGSIERFIYPTLFPEKLVTKDAQLYSTVPGLSTESPDRKWLLIQQTATLQKFDLYDLSKETLPVTVLTLPDNLLTTSPASQAYQFVEWSTDNRHVLLKHTFGDKYEFIMVDRETPAASFNVNRTLGLEMTEVAMRDKQFDKLYVYQAISQLLQVADVKPKTLTPFLTKVVAFKPHGDNTMLYITDDGKKPGMLALKIRDGDAEHLIHYFKTGAEYVLDLAKFDNKWYAAAGSKNEDKVYVYKDPIEVAKHANQQEIAPIMILRLDKVKRISFSDNARFIAAQNGSKFAVYDAEYDRRFSYDVKLPVASDNFATWMDGHRLLLNVEGKTIVFDYDGINLQTLAPISPGHIPLFDRDRVFLFTVGPSVGAPGKYALTQTALKLKP